MKTIDVMGKPCPVPVIEAKKALAAHGKDGVLVKVDNIDSVRNLEKMAKAQGYNFSFVENDKNSFKVIIKEDEKNTPKPETANDASNTFQYGASSNGTVVVISRNTMGEGAEKLGKTLIKAYIYSLTELTMPPDFLIFFNSGVHLTSSDSNTVEDLKKLEEKGTVILICGTCVNFYELQGKLAVGTITNMYEISEKMANANRVINI